MKTSYSFKRSKDGPPLGVYEWDAPDTLQGWEHALGSEAAVMRLANAEVGRQVAVHFRRSVDEKTDKGMSEEQAARETQNELRSVDWVVLCTRQQRGVSNRYKDKLAANLLQDVLHRRCTIEEALAKAEELGIELA